MLAAENRISSDQFAVAAGDTGPRPTERMIAPMRSRFCFFALLLVSIFAILLLATPWASAGPILVGSYKITENTDLGSQVRITVQVNFVNPGDTALTVTQVGLHGISAPGQSVNVSSNTIVQSHSSAQVSLQFLLAKDDFKTWSMGPHQHFLVTIQPTGDKVTLTRVALLRTQG